MKSGIRLLCMGALCGSVPACHQSQRYPPPKLGFYNCRIGYLEIHAAEFVLLPRGKYLRVDTQDGFSEPGYYSFDDGVLDLTPSRSEARMRLRLVENIDPDTFALLNQSGKQTIETCMWAPTPPDVARMISH